jgi:hypothetical protein
MIKPFQKSYGRLISAMSSLKRVAPPYANTPFIIIAEIFIYVCYLVSGMVVYSAQGQFTFNPAYQGKPFQKSYGRLISAMSSLKRVAPPYANTPFIIALTFAD